MTLLSGLHETLRLAYAFPADPVLNLPFTADEYHVGCFDSGRYTMLPLGANGMWSFLDIVE